MQTCGPCAKATWRRRSRAARRSGRGRETCGIAVRAGDRERARARRSRDRRAAELDVARRVAVDHRGGRLEPQRLLDRVRQQAAVRLARARAGRDATSRCRTALAIIPSVVSMPPNSSTAALETTSSRSRPPAAPAAAATQRRGRVALERRRRSLARSAAYASRPAGVTGVARGHRPSPPRRSASYQPSTAPASASSRPSACVDDRGRQRAGQAAAQLRRARAGSIASISRSVSAATSSVKRSPHRVEPERPRERIAVAAVLRAVEREHARADHPAGGEARVVDGERLRVAHHLQREVAPRDEPALERGQPRHRLPLAKARQQRMRVELQLGQGRGGAEGEGLSPGRCGHAPSVANRRPRGGAARVAASGPVIAPPALPPPPAVPPVSGFTVTEARVSPERARFGGRPVTLRLVFRAAAPLDLRVVIRRAGRTVRRWRSPPRPRAFPSGCAGRAHLCRPPRPGRPLPRSCRAGGRPATCGGQLRAARPRVPGARRSLVSRPRRHLRRSPQRRPHARGLRHQRAVRHAGGRGPRRPGRPQPLRPGALRQPRDHPRPRRAARLLVRPSARARRV